MLRAFATAFLLLFACGCATVRRVEIPTAPHFKVVTYNVNRGINPARIAPVLNQINADIVCLQETDNVEETLRPLLQSSYSHLFFRDSNTRVGGGYVFASKFPGREIAYVESDTEWFDGWIMAFETPAGPIQILNVHLRPPYKGGWIRGYFSTRGDRLGEIERFYSRCDPNIPLMVLGYFNDSPRSRAVRFLESKKLKNALPQFDRRSPTWKWRTRLVTLRRRMDHILYPPQLHCTSARVIHLGPSDHFPVAATFTRAR